MRRGKLLWIGIIILLLISLVGSYLFYTNTGGDALSRAIRYDLFRDVPDRTYSWRDFTDRGKSEAISGFYAYGDQDGFSMWTLSGLKTFTHVPKVSVYQYEDVCAAVLALSNNPNNADRVPATQEVTVDITHWQSLIKQENLVTVMRLAETEGRNDIDTVWSYSGIYKQELHKLQKDSCL